MAKFWYYTIIRCPDCGTTDERYDHTAPWCDSGLNSSPVMDEFCEECFAARQAEDEKENV